MVHHATAEQVKQYARKPAKAPWLTAVLPNLEVPSCVRLLKSLMGLNNEAETWIPWLDLELRCY